MIYKTGSSPRQRGTYINYRPCLNPSRFIPAPAGNIHIGPECLIRAAVHPRASGEHQNRTL